MKGLLQTAGALLDGIELVCAWLAALMILGIMVTISADVFGRYLLGNPIGWAIEFSEYALMTIPFLSMAWLVRQAGHVRIDILLNALGKRNRARLNLLTNVLATMTCGAAAYAATLTTISQYERNVVTIGIYPMQKYLLISVIAFGLTLAFIEFLRATFRGWRETA